MDRDYEALTIIILSVKSPQEAGVQEGLCGIPDVDKFQTVIDNYQIIVLSAKHFNTIVYKGPRRGENKFNSITMKTTLTSSLLKSYWCFECKRVRYERERSLQQVMQ